MDTAPLRNSKREAEATLKSTSACTLLHLATIVHRNSVAFAHQISYIYISSAVHALAHNASSKRVFWPPICVQGHVAVIEALLSAGPKALTMLTGKGQTALHLAERNGHTEAVEALLSVNACILQ